jgi:hypothetical protein
MASHSLGPGHLVFLTTRTPPCICSHPPTEPLRRRRSPGWIRRPNRSASAQYPSQSTASLLIFVHACHNRYQADDGAPTILRPTRLSHRYGHRAHIDAVREYRYRPRYCKLGGFFATSGCARGHGPRCGCGTGRQRHRLSGSRGLSRMVGTQMSSDPRIRSSSTSGGRRIQRPPLGRPIDAQPPCSTPHAGDEKHRGNRAQPCQDHDSEQPGLHSRPARSAP